MVVEFTNAHQPDGNTRGFPLEKSSKQIEFGIVLIKGLDAISIDPQLVIIPIETSPRSNLFRIVASPVLLR